MALEDKLNEKNIIKKKKRPFLKSFLLATAFLASPDNLHTETYKPQAPETSNYETILNENEVYNNNDMYSFNIKEVTTPKWTLQGRVERAERFRDLFEKYENKYSIPSGLLAGLAMQESYAEPITLNSTDDGGGGPMQFQPGTARSLGMKILGESNRTGRDFNHGRELRDLLERHDYNIDIIARIDERFDPTKAIPAAAFYLSHLKDRFGTWERAVSAYRRGRPAINPMNTPDVTNIYAFMNAYNKGLSDNIVSR